MAAFHCQHNGRMAIWGPLMTSQNENDVINRSGVRDLLQVHGPNQLGRSCFNHCDVLAFKRFCSTALESRNLKGVFDHFRSRDRFETMRNRRFVWGFAYRCSTENFDVCFDRFRVNVRDREIKSSQNALKFQEF
jgi:hypothetical protein